MLPSFWEILPEIMNLILEISVVAIVIGVVVNRATRNYLYSNVATISFYYLALGLTAFQIREYAIVILLILLAVKNIITISIDLKCSKKAKGINGIRTKNRFNSRSIYRLSK